MMYTCPLATRFSTLIQVAKYVSEMTITYRLISKKKAKMQDCLFGLIESFLGDFDIKVNPVLA